MSKQKKRRTFEEYSQHMRRMSVFRVAVAFIGCCIGAGFLSGQELWQFFGSHGIMEFAGLGVSALCFFGAGAAVLSLATDSGETRMDRIIVWFDCPPLRGAVAAFEVVFLFIIYVLSAAGMGSLFGQIFDCSTIWGSAAFCLLSTVVSLCGMRGLVRTFSLIVPLLVASTGMICIFAITTAEGMHFPVVRAEGLVSGNWWLDAVTYAVFGVFCAVPVLAPLGVSVPSGRVARRGILLGCCCFFSLALIILLAIATEPSVAKSALPMLELAFSNGAVPGFIYGILLMLGIFSAGVSSQSAINEYFIQRLPSARRFLLPVTGLVSLIAFLLGLFGFRNLIGTLYPILGYIGVFPLSLLLVHVFVFYRRKYREKRENANGKDASE